MKFWFASIPLQLTAKPLSQKKKPNHLPSGLMGKRQAYGFVFRGVQEQSGWWQLPCLGQGTRLVPRGSLHLSGNPGHNIRNIPVSQHRQATSFISLIYSFTLYLLSIYYVSCSRLTSSWWPHQNPGQQWPIPLSFFKNILYFSSLLWNDF